MKILIVGCGSIGARHVRNAGNLAEIAVFDTDQKLAVKTASLTGAVWFDTLEQALRWGPDGVVVATPNHLHLQVAGQVVRAGADVLIEKPLAPSLESVAEFLQLTADLKRRAYVVCNMRFHPAVSTLRTHIPAIGRPLFARAHVGNYLPNMRPTVDYRSLYCANRNQGGGVILDAIHEVDYLMWLFGPVQNVSCTAGKLSDLDIDVEDYGCLCLTHRQQVISEIQMDYLRPFKRRGCEIVGDQGILLWESEGKQPEQCKVRLYDKRQEQWQTLFEADSIDTDRPYVLLMQEFLAALSGKKNDLLIADKAAAELSVVLQALEASKMLNTSIR